MKRLIFIFTFTLIGLLGFAQNVPVDSVATVDSVAVDSMAVMADDIDELVGDEEGGGIHKQLKTKFVD